ESPGIRTRDEAIARAKELWGPDATAWGVTPRLCVGCPSNDTLAPMLLAQGVGATWEEAFANAQPHRGHYHLRKRPGRVVPDTVLCYGDCGEIVSIGAQMRAEE